MEHLLCWQVWEGNHRLVSRFQIISLLMMVVWVFMRWYPLWQLYIVLISSFCNIHGLTDTFCCSMSGILEFLDTSDMTIMAQSEHFMATDVEWDPTGRYVATGVSWWGHKVDNAFWMWNFQGKLLYKQPLERFCQLLWRPRPTTLLTAALIKVVHCHRMYCLIVQENLVWSC